MARVAQKAAAVVMFFAAVLALTQSARMRADDCYQFEFAKDGPCPTTPLENCGDKHLVPGGDGEPKCSGNGRVLIHTGPFHCDAMNHPPFPGFYTRCVDGMKKNAQGEMEPWKAPCLDTQKCVPTKTVEGNYTCVNSQMDNKTNDAQRKMSINCLPNPDPGPN